MDAEQDVQSELTFRLLQPSDEAALEAFLQPRVATSMFLLGNSRAAGLVDSGRPYSGTYAAAFAGPAIVGVVAHYWNGNLVTQAPFQLDSLWRAAVAGSGRPIRGVIGPCDQVQAVKAALGLGPAAIQHDEAEPLYCLALRDLVVPEALRTGQVQARRIGPGDVELITDWHIGLSQEALHDASAPQRRAELRASVARAVEEGKTWILEAGGRAVATTAFNTAFPEAVQIGGVYTPPEFRSRGYCRAVVAASLLDARAEGVETAVLFTGPGNRPAQRAYESLGFQPVGQYCLFLLREALDLHRPR